MNARQKKFILNKLIPFILREQGNGFAMSTWKQAVPKKGVDPADFAFDNYCQRTKLPACGTVACIGGSTAMLIDRPRVTTVRPLAEALGLTREQANGLFYRWESDDAQVYETAWPRSFAQRFEAAEGPLAKARVAVSLLRLVVKTNGACLKSKEY